jgi:hypothetical protein
MTSDDMATLAADFPGWHVWRGRSGTGALTDWHATASRALRRAGTLGRLTAADARGLRALLGQQQALRRDLAA